MKRAVKRKTKSAEAVSSLAERVAEAPRLASAKEAKARLAEWLAGIARNEPGKALKRLIEGAPKVEALLAGLADGSPFLWELATADAPRLLAVLNADLDTHLAALLSRAARAVPALKDE